MFKQIVLIGLVALLSACASSVPSTSRLSDDIMMGIKASSDVVDFQFNSNVMDGEIKPSAKGSREVQGSHPGYTHNESTSLNKMMGEFASMKFNSLSSDSNIKIKVLLNDFWIEQYSTDSTGQMWLAALGGGEIHIMIVAHLGIAFEIIKDGKVNRKKLHISSESIHVSGMGTGTSTSNIYRGSESIEFRVADAMNAVNNKAIIMLNHFLASNQM
ncbi:MAG: hypothetical protein Q9M82_02195 [Mariprofundus sp.]|nr:hypothetical protein [Mariprofundus sp.]